MERDNAKASEYAFEFPKWHSGSACDVSIVTVGGAYGALIWCAHCRVLAPIEAVGRRITNESSAKED